MLKPEVVSAVRAKKFHVWAVSNIDEGVELLTGVTAGKPRKDGTYPEGTLYRKVTDMLEELTKRAMEVNRGTREPVAPTSATTNGARIEREPQRRPRKPPTPGRRTSRG